MLDVFELLRVHFPIRRSHPEVATALTLSLLEARTWLALAAAVACWPEQISHCRRAELRFPVSEPVLPIADHQADPAQTDALDIVIPIADAQAQLVLRLTRASDLSAALPVLCELIDTLDLRAADILAAIDLNQAITAGERREHLQRALYAIADLAYTDLDMHDMLARIHALIGELTYAENLIIATYDDVCDSMRMLYFADKSDAPLAYEGLELSGKDVPNSLTLALLRRGHPMMGSSRDLLAELGLDAQPELGPECVDWLGVPMLEGDRVHGAVVVQSYDEQHRYNEEDRALLVFVAQHILTVLHRKQAQEGTELEVQRRTLELADANSVLRDEVNAHQRSLQLQEALFRIAELASARGSVEEFCANVHGVVNELLDVRNFFIALVDESGTMLHFPFSVDERDAPRRPRPIASGVTEHVLRMKKPFLASKADLAELTDSGVLGLIGTRPECWLGIPLLLGDTALGVIVVQSYTPGLVYTRRDQDILTFVSHHVANALERKHAQESLRAANEALEVRVQERTVKLEQIADELRGEVDVRQRMEARFKYEALHDALSGLPNRASMMQRLADALDRYQQDPSRLFAVLFLDLDRFKVVNDSVGHRVGDEMLVEVGRRILSCAHEPNCVARLGGDEFVLLLEGIDSVADAERTANRVLATLVDPIWVGDKELYTSASIGIAVINSHYKSAEELLRDSDAAMYRAKSKGLQRYELFDDGMHQEALRVLDLERELRRGISRCEFEPYFQPIVALENGAVLGYEALMRWMHSERGQMLPDVFLAIAEDSGSIEQIDWQIFERVFDAVASLPEERSYVGINVSARHFRSPRLATRLLKLLDTYRVPPQRVRIEITEGALLENPEQARETVLQLRDAGVLTALDDFGTGYSSLSYLHHFPLHALKIDKSFVAELLPGQAGRSAAVVRAIRTLADSLELEVIAEGIETRPQLEALLQLDCRIGQGFLFARPMPLAALTTLV